MLHLAAFSGNEAAGLFLLAQGAQPNHANKKGETPLHASALKGHHSLVRELLKGYVMATCLFLSHEMWVVWLSLYFQEREEQKNLMIETLSKSLSTLKTLYFLF